MVSEQRLPDDGSDHPVDAGPEVVDSSRFDERDASSLRSLVAAATDVDGVAPLSEHALLHLRSDAGSHAHHLVVRDGVGLVAVAHLDLAQGDEPASAEVVVRPDRRRQGTGAAVLRRLESLADGPLRVWAHGNVPAAQGFAATQGYDVVRELWQMSRPLTQHVPDVVVPAGFTMRAFVPGADDAAWLAVNAAAFAHHPEQGAWTTADLTERMVEPWFDPSGFLLLEDDATGDLAGFHWTKVHPQGVGEVYVVGVAPTYQGRGLAKPLTLAGLHHLRDQGLPAVILYVDGDNTAAVRTYSGLGFTRSALDVQYARRLLPPS
jgi:mycothiol synthase